MAAKSTKQRDGQQRQPVPQLITPIPGAVVLDTNIWGKGHLSINALETHAKKLATGGVRVWVPTQVLLEWVSHAAADARDAIEKWNRLHRTGLLTGRFPVSPNVDDILESLRQKVASIDNVSIIPMTGDAAVAGLRDQILGTGPGKAPGRVKTGAVDSSWVRDAITAAEDAGIEILFVTRNYDDVQKTADAMKVPVSIRHDDAMYDSLFGTVAAPEQLVRRITARLDQLAAPDLDQYPAYMESLLPINDIQINASAFNSLDRYAAIGTSLVHTSQVIAITAVKAVKDPPTPVVQHATDSARDLPDDGANNADQPTVVVETTTPTTVEFTLLVLADVNLRIHDRGGDVEMSKGNGVIGPCLVTASLVADVEGIVQIAAGGSALAETSTPGFPDPLEALRWVLEQLPAIADVDLDTDDIDQDEFTFTGASGKSVTATRSGYDDWTLTFDVGEKYVDISCHYDPGARVWAGPDSFDLRHPYYLSSDDDGLTDKGPYPAIGAVWRHVHGI